MVDPPNLKSPPPSIPRPLGLSLWEPFNQTKHSVSLVMDEIDFMHQDVRFTAMLPPLTFIHPPGVLVQYFLHGGHSDKFMLAGTTVILSDSLCPPFEARPNKNLFQHLFGIEFNYENHSRVCDIWPFKFTRCFGFIDDFTYRLSQPANKFGLDAARYGASLGGSKTLKT
jgi:hypothetical protein